MSERKRAGAQEKTSAASNDGSMRHHFNSDADQDEARRILDRVQREASGLEGMSRRAIDRVAKHVTTGDENAEDAVELWSARIGRALGLIITLAIMGWLLFYLLQS